MIKLIELKIPKVQVQKEIKTIAIQKHLNGKYYNREAPGVCH